MIEGCFETFSTLDKSVVRFAMIEFLAEQLFVGGRVLAVVQPRERSGGGNVVGPLPRELSLVGQGNLQQVVGKALVDDMVTQPAGATQDRNEMNLAVRLGKGESRVFAVDFVIRKGDTLQYFDE